MYYGNNNGVYYGHKFVFLITLNYYKSNQIKS